MIKVYSTDMENLSTVHVIPDRPHGSIGRGTVPDIQSGADPARLKTSSPHSLFPPLNPSRSINVPQTVGESSNNALQRWHTSEAARTLLRGLSGASA